MRYISNESLDVTATRCFVNNVSIRCWKLSVENRILLFHLGEKKFILLVTSIILPWNSVPRQLHATGPGDCWGYIAPWGEDCPLIPLPVCARQLTSPRYFTNFLRISLAKPAKNTINNYFPLSRKPANIWYQYWRSYCVDIDCKICLWEEDPVKNSFSFQWKEKLAVIVA